MAKTLSAHGDDGSNIGGAVDREAWRDMVARARNLMIMQKDIGEDLKELCAECDEKGIATKKELRRHARTSLMDQDIVEQQRERDDMLLAALGDFATLPLGESAMRATQRPKRSRGRPRKNQGHEALDRAEAHFGDEDDPLPFEEEARLH